MHSLHGRGHRPANTSGAKTENKKWSTLGLPSSWQLTFDLLSNLVARSNVHGAVQLKFDEGFVPEFCLGENVGPSAAQTVANTSHC